MISNGCFATCISNLRRVCGLHGGRRPGSMVGVPPAGEPVWVLFDSNFSDCLAELGSNSSSFEHFRDHGRGVRIPSPIRFNASDCNSWVRFPLKPFLWKGDLECTLASALSTFETSNSTPDAFIQVRRSGARKFTSGELIDGYKTIRRLGRTAA